MVANVRTDSTRNLTPFGIPGTVVDLFILGREYIAASSVRAGGARQSPQTCNIINGENHRYFGNCGEMNAFAIALNLGWISWGTNNRLVFTRGSAITAYGIKNKNTGEVGAMNPCSSKDIFWAVRICCRRRRTCGWLLGVGRRRWGFGDCGGGSFKA